MRFFDFMVARLLYESPNRAKLIESLTKDLPGKLVVEDTNDLQDLWNRVQTGVDSFVRQVNDALVRRGISGAQKTSIFANAISRMMELSGTSLDIPGYGKISRIASDMMPRTYSKDKADFVTKDYKERIRSRYQELTQGGMNDQQARAELRKAWKGLEDERTLSTILRGIIVREEPTTAQKVKARQTASKPERPDFELTYQQIQANFRKLVGDDHTWESMDRAARSLYPQFQEKFPDNTNVPVMIWHMLESEAKLHSVEVPITYTKWVRSLRAGNQPPV